MKTILQQKESETKKPLYSVKQIFQDHWERYSKENRDSLRDIEIRETEKMLSCRDENRGSFTCFCPICNKYHICYFGCNSRLCSPCGKVRADKFAKNLAKRAFKVPQRHLILSLPEILWVILKRHRRLLKPYMDSAIKFITKTFSEFIGEDVIPGVITVLHPFAKDVQHKPHLHNIVTSGGFDKNGKFISLPKFVEFDVLHKEWQKCILEVFRKVFPKQYLWLIDHLYNIYPNGFHAHLKKEVIYGYGNLLKYIGRYINHPAIANTRIYSYDGKEVRFWYEDDKEMIHFVTMEVDDFITALLQHIPEPQFKMIRYYGAYSRKKKKRYRTYLVQESLSKKVFPVYSKRRGPKCPDCKNEMIILWYNEKPPPKDKSKITSWMVLPS